MSSDQKILLQKAILEIRDLKSRLKRVQEQYVEPIAIVGASCRFPGGANDLDSYWDLLSAGQSGISATPTERWDADDYYHPDPDTPGKICTKSGGFLNVSAFDFDAHFFGISPREAESMDPQQRLLLELCWEAIEHANIVPESLFKSNTGVFMGLSSLDNATRIIGEAPSSDIDGYYGTGIALAPVAGRISYLFGFTGPSFVVDTACSSSLLSLHLACESLRRRECDLALGGGVQLLTHPGVSVAFTKARMLSVDGQCRTFDASANGYVRGEGGGVLLLKRMSDAVRDSDTILAVINGSAVNQDGASGGLTVPSGPSQQAVIKSALQMSGLSPLDIGYIESHGTGTPLGDPIEIGALHSVYGTDRPMESPLIVGSVKTNIGHLEAGAGVASAIKVMLSLRNKSIAPHLNYHTPNPMIPWDQIPIRIPVSTETWSHSGSRGMRAAGISSFGFSGTNVHLIMSDAPTNQTEPHSVEVNQSSNVHGQLLVLSAKTRNSLLLLARKHASKLRDLKVEDWPSYAMTAATRRTEFKYRLSLSSESPSEAADILELWSKTGHHKLVQSGNWDEGKKPKVLMLFSGQGAQYIGMGKELYESSATFKEDMDLCDQVITPILGYSILDCMLNGTQELNHTVNTQPALFVLELALARLWVHYGGAIDGVIGHSVGEYAAAVIAGVMSIQDAARLIAIRGKLMQSLPLDGGMLAVFTSYQELNDILIKSSVEVSIATSNGPNNQVLSGLKSDLQTIKEMLDEKGIESKELAVSHAFHSHLMDPILDEFRSHVSNITLNDPTIPFYTNLTGKLEKQLPGTSEYWVRHIRESVMFHDAIKNALLDGYTNIIEAGPKSTLINLARSIVKTDDLSEINMSWDSLLSTERNDYIQFISALGSYWCEGGSLKWESLSAGFRDIPTYAFDRYYYKKEVLLDSVNHVQSRSIENVATSGHPLIHSITDSPLLDVALYQSAYSASKFDIFRDHKVFDKFVVAGATHLSLSIAASQHFWGKESVALQDVVFPSALVLPDKNAIQVHLSIKKTDSKGSFRLISLHDSEADKSESVSNTHAIGSTTDKISVPGVSQWDNSFKQCEHEISADIIYETQSKRHIVVGESYQWIDNVWLGPSQALGALSPPVGISTEAYSIHPGMLDSCFGLLVMTAQMQVEDTFIPFGVKSMTIFRSITSESLRVIARKRKFDEEAGILVGDITIETNSGEIVAELIGLEGRKASVSALFGSESTRSSEFIFKRIWKELDTARIIPSNLETLIIILDDTDEKVIKKLQSIPNASILQLNRSTAKTIYNDVPSVHIGDLNAYWKTVERQPDHILLCDSATISNGSNSKIIEKTNIDSSDHIDRLEAVVLFLQSIIRNRLLVPVSTLTFADMNHPTDYVSNAATEAINAVLLSVRQEFNELSGSSIIVGQTGFHSDNWTQYVGDMGKLAEHVFISDTTMYCARLTKTQQDPNDSSVLDKNASYIITGATGSLAAHLIEYLSNMGVSKLILMARSFSSVQLAHIQKLAKNPAEIEYLSCDISDYNALSNAITTSKIKLDTIKGIFHLAGTTSDISFMDLARDNLNKTHLPKYQGIRNLMELLDSSNLDLLMTYSSIAAEFGNTGQEAYAAANRSMDAWLMQYSSDTCIVKSIRWGPWIGSGMTSKISDTALARLSVNGIRPISSETASRILDDVFARNSSEIIVCGDFDWNSDFFNTNLTLELRTKSALAEAKDSFIDSFFEVSANARNRFISRTLNTLLIKALRLPDNFEIDPRDRLFDLGVDSLIAIELKNQLQKKIGTPVSSTLLFDYPTLEKLSAHVADLIHEHHAPVIDDSVDSVPDPTLIDVDSLSDEDAEKALLQALIGLREGGNDD